MLDVGSNSARMIVFRLRDGEHLDVIEDARAPLRLARELHTGAELGPEAIERTLEALRDFRAVAEGAGADRILAVATSAVRDALDGHLLLERARELGRSAADHRRRHRGAPGLRRRRPRPSGHERRDARRRRRERGDLTVPRSPPEPHVDVRARFAPRQRPVPRRRPADRLAAEAMRKHVSETLRAADIEDVDERRGPRRDRRDGSQPGEGRHASDRASPPAAARLRARRPIGWRPSSTIWRARR